MRWGEMVDVTAQTVSGWERGEYMPDTNKLIRLAKVLGVSLDYLLIEEEPEKYTFNLREKYFSEERMYTKVKSAASELKLMNTLKALPFARTAHEGQIRKSNDNAAVPYISHPLNMACHALALGIKEDEIIAACLLHDVMEDCGTPLEELPVNEAGKKCGGGADQNQGGEGRPGGKPHPK